MNAAAPAVAIAGELPAEVEQHYDVGSFCSVATIADVSLVQNQIQVRLDIDARWTRSLLLNGDGLRQRWFALHCPHPLSDSWRVLEKNQDIVITSPLPELGIYALGCREYFNNQGHSVTN